MGNAMKVLQRRKRGITRCHDNRRISGVLKTAGGLATSATQAVNGASRSESQHAARSMQASSWRDAPGEYRTIHGVFRIGRCPDTTTIGHKDCTDTSAHTICRDYSTLRPSALGCGELECGDCECGDCECGDCECGDCECGDCECGDCECGDCECGELTRVRESKE